MPATERMSCLECKDGIRALVIRRGRRCRAGDAHVVRLLKLHDFTEITAFHGDINPSGNYYIVRVRVLQQPFIEHEVSTLPATQNISLLQEPAALGSNLLCNYYKPAIDMQS